MKDIHKLRKKVAEKSRALELLKNKYVRVLLENGEVEELGKEVARLKDLLRTRNAKMASSVAKIGLLKAELARATKRKSFKIPFIKETRHELFEAEKEVVEAPTNFSEPDTFPTTYEPLVSPLCDMPLKDTLDTGGFHRRNVQTLIDDTHDNNIITGCDTQGYYIKLKSNSFGSITIYDSSKEYALFYEMHPMFSKREDSEALEAMLAKKSHFKKGSEDSNKEAIVLLVLEFGFSNLIAEYVVSEFGLDQAKDVLSMCDSCNINPMSLKKS